jgi:RNA recognition motif-containing protein
MNVVAEEWSKTLDKEDYLKMYKNKKLLSHVKVMKDSEKTDDQGNEMPSGQGFVEFTKPELALFAVRYLNNLEIAARRGLIVDFSMEDQRALFKRKEKIERWRSIAKDKKA